MSIFVLCAALSVGATAAELVRAPAATWRVTRGRLDLLPDGRARVRAPKMRAVVTNSDGDAAELRFVYEGASDGVAPLASGEVRRQIGLKLRAEDGCNLLYVMWRLSPKAGLVVSLKRNPGQRTHAECGARGYTNLVPATGLPPPPAPGTEHRLHARLDGRVLRVWADGTLAWQGEVPDAALGLRGPVGVRSDNGRFTFELRARGGPSGAPPAGGDDEY